VHKRFGTEHHASRFTHHLSTLPKRNPCFLQVVWGHLNIDLIAHADADEMFAHFA
jgi:hypothetical protein